MSQTTHTAVVTAAVRGPLETIQVPTVTPSAGEVRVRVNWTASTPLDLHQNDGGLLVNHPQVLGDGVAGTVVELGPGVTGLKVGDSVFGFCWREQKEKAHQEFVTAPEYLFGKVPDNCSPQEAVTLPNNFVTCFHAITKDLELPLPWPLPQNYHPEHADSPILIWGGSSSVGQFALQIFRHWGYTNLLATSSTQHHKLLQSFGAKHVFDYRNSDVVESVLKAAGGPVPFVLDCIGSKYGSLEPISKIVARGSKVAILLPVIVKDATEDEAPIYEMDVSAAAAWKDGVVARGVRTHYYLQDEFFKEKLQSEIMPTLLAEGVVKPNKVKIVEGKTVLDRAQAAMDMLRRKECNEARPACAACLRRDILCEYGVEKPRRPVRDEAAVSSSASPQQAPSPVAPYPAFQNFESALSVESTERRLLEMKLVHHFTTQTVTRDFLSVHDEGVFTMWVETAPALGFKHDFLLNMIISIAALHITKIEPGREDMADTHRLYFNAAIKQHRIALNKISRENAEAVCIANTLVTLPTFVLLQNTEVARYSPPLQVFYLLRGSVPVYKQGLPLLARDSMVHRVVSAKPNMLEYQIEAQKEHYRQPFETLLKWRAPNEEIDEESQKAYEHALSHIGCILHYIEQNENAYVLRRILYSFLVLCQQTFIDRVKEHNPRALVILAHYFSLIKAADGVWWMRGISEREVFGIQSILPEVWQWAMSWPLARLALYASIAAPQMGS
ncbi:hypothetical protein BP6252_01222 [Coleophoma cylindrospora]|uniref:Enoyl reductase (ER) domain-containing protein n=1 Tax=Coleophoma cylindrospora TaxID=1849047 RepID=A0A3D8SS94_9HELO|nr:hypothetical protein BP6252_01222 [Coleophoma cylindrospora]